jgi:uncharacterized repeat protein (TIGR01451 family)
VWIGKDRIVRGLNLEDAVVHYDTADGRVLVQPTNRVCIYAPRFAAVRKVSGTAQQEQHQRTARLELPIQSGRHEEWQAANTVLQPVQVERELGMKPANSFRTRAAGAELDNDRVLAAAQDRRDLYEEVNVARRSTLENAEKPRLAETLESALVRTLGQDVQVVIDGHSAMAAVSDRSVETVFVCELPPGKPRLQVIKTSSRREAKPGDVVDFAIRFVNVGDQLIRHVTVVDNLAPRLEYIVGTAQCTLKAEFSAQENERESLVLRWEIAAPLKVGQGGEIRFRCRVL